MSGVYCGHPADEVLSEALRLLCEMVEAEGWMLWPDKPQELLDRDQVRDFVERIEGHARAVRVALTSGGGET